MKTDIDSLMTRDQLDALWITGSMAHNPDMVYFTGIHHVTKADLFKIKGEPPILFIYADMEREEAALSGLEVRVYDENRPLDVYLKKYGGDASTALAARCAEVIQELGLCRGRMAVSGMSEVGIFKALLDKIKPMLPELNFIGYYKDSPIEKARMTKDAHEIERIRQMGRLTTQVIARTADFLTSRQVKDSQLLDEDGSPLRIAQVKQHIRLWLAELGMDNPEETIFSIGRDAGIPHNSGNPQDIITTGAPIIFDIFPCEAGGGYFYDITRTWCLGDAPQDVALLHQQVKSVYDKIIGSLKPNVPFRDYQDRTCELFSGLGHTTIQDDYTAKEGYIHSLGHGIGLNVHETPFCGIASSPDERLLPGAVFTIEPGLYYPSRNMGVRIEDSLAVLPDGEIEILAPYPYDLVLPMRG